MMICSALKKKELCLKHSTRQSDITQVDEYTAGNFSPIDQKGKNKAKLWSYWRQNKHETTDPVHSLSAKAGPQYSHWPACANSALTVCFAETEASQEPYAQ